MFGSPKELHRLFQKLIKIKNCTSKLGPNEELTKSFHWQMK